MSEILERAKKYSAEIQKRTRAEQLEWFGEQLRVSPESLLRLLGYGPAKAREYIRQGKTVAELAALKPVDTLRLTEVLREMSSQVGHDLKWLEKSFHQPPSVTSEFANNPNPRTKKITRPTSERYARKVRLGGPGVYSALTEYFRLMKYQNSVQGEHVTVS